MSEVVACDAIEIVALRGGAMSREITLDYRIDNPGGDSWPCRCGASRCRGQTGRSVFTLPEAFQREYLPLVAPWSSGVDLVGLLLRVRMILRSRGPEPERPCGSPRDEPSG
jgi:hypothetical protein